MAVKAGKRDGNKQMFDWKTEQKVRMREREVRTRERVLKALKLVVNWKGMKFTTDKAFHHEAWKSRKFQVAAHVVHATFMKNFTSHSFTLAPFKFIMKFIWFLCAFHVFPSSWLGCFYVRSEGSGVLKSWWKFKWIFHLYALGCMTKDYVMTLSVFSPFTLRLQIKFNIRHKA